MNERDVHLEPCPFCGEEPQSMWLNSSPMTKQPYDWICGCFKFVYILKGDL